MASYKRKNSRKLNKQMKRKHGKCNIFNKGFAKEMRHDYMSIRKNLRSSNKIDKHIEDYC